MPDSGLSGQLKMKAFAYLGNHEETTLYGVVFPRDVFVPVENEKLIAKLQGNSHFAQLSEGAESDQQEAVPQEPVSTAPEQASQEAKQPAKRRGRKPKEV